MPVYKPGEIGGQVLDPIDPDDVEPFDLDLASLENGNGSENWLDRANSEEIASATVSVTNATKDSNSLINSNTTVRVWISEPTLSATVSIEIQVTTNSSPARTKNFTLLVPCESR